MGILQNENAIPTAVAGGFYSHQIEQSARFDRADQSYLTQDFGSVTAAKWTLSVWFKRAETGYAYSTLIGRTGGGSQIYFNASDAIVHDSQYTNTVDGVFRDGTCLLYTSPSPRDATLSRMPSSA